MLPASEQRPWLEMAGTAQALRGEPPSSQHATTSLLGTVTSRAQMYKLAANMMSRRMVSRDSAILLARVASPTASAALSSSLISSSNRRVALQD